PEVLLAAVAQDQAQVLGRDALYGGELLGVDATLQDGRRLGFAGELGVGHLVAIRAERARPVDSHQEVWMAAPPAVEEGALVDDAGAVPHGGDHLGVRFGQASDGAVRERELHYPAAAGPQAVQVPRFVLQPPT